MIGSVIPDAVEGFRYDSDRWKKKHRKASHWLLFYVLVCLILFVFLKLTVNTFSSTVILKKAWFYLSRTDVFSDLFINVTLVVFSYVLFFIFAGCVLHILQDALTGPVPVIHPKKRVFSLRIMKTRSITEALFVTLLFIITIYVECQRFKLLFVSLLKAK